MLSRTGSKMPQSVCYSRLVTWTTINRSQRCAAEVKYTGQDNFGSSTRQRVRPQWYVTVYGAIHCKPTSLNNTVPLPPGTTAEHGREVLINPNPHEPQTYLDDVNVKAGLSLLVMVPDCSEQYLDDINVKASLNLLVVVPDSPEQ
jgi:hypothetical protein